MTAIVDIMNKIGRCVVSGNVRQVCVCVCVCVCVRARMCLHLCVRVVARGVWVCVLVWSHRFGRTCLLFTVARRRRAFVDR